MLLCQMLPRLLKETDLGVKQGQTKVYMCLSVRTRERARVCVFGHLFPSACGFEMMKRPLQLVRSG